VVLTRVDAGARVIGSAPLSNNYSFPWLFDFSGPCIEGIMQPSSNSAPNLRPGLGKLRA
jgi:hypothetical protein